jgi:shikimate dehydrogenase
MTTKKYAVIGDPIQHSSSPHMHMAMAKELNIDIDYRAIHITPENLKHDIETLKEQNFQGFNVTVPHKEDIIAYLNDIDPEAKIIGAVNTVINTNNTLKGYNTDGKGFLYALTQHANIDIINKNISIIGVGGSAKAIALTLASHPIQTLTLINRSPERMTLLATRIKSLFPNLTLKTYLNNDPQISNILTNTDIVIQTTPLGMTGKTISQLPLPDMSWVTKI